MKVESTHTSNDWSRFMFIFSVYSILVGWFVDEFVSIKIRQGNIVTRMLAYLTFWEQCQRKISTRYSIRVKRPSRYTRFSISSSTQELKIGKLYISNCEQILNKFISNKKNTINNTGSWKLFLFLVIVI